MVRGGVHDDVHITARQHLAEVVHQIRAAEFCEGAGGLTVFGIDIADRDHLHPFVGEKGFEVGSPLPSHADASQAYPAVRCHGSSPAQHRRGENQWEGGFEELTAGRGWHSRGGGCAPQSTPRLGRFISLPRL